MKQTYYMTSCMCKLSAEKLKRRGDKRICSIHGGEIIHRKRECIDCNKELILCGTGTGKLRCNEHEKLHNLRLQRVANNKSYAPTKAVNAIKKAEDTKARKKKLEEKKVVVDPKKSKPVVKKKAIPKKLIGWSFDKRGDYCCWLKTCQSKKAVDCVGCLDFSGVWFGYDPGRLGIGA